MELSPELQLGGRYILGNKLGSGSFGEIYAGKDAKTMELYAVKIEISERAHNQLKREFKIYRALKGVGNISNHLFKTNQFIF